MVLLLMTIAILDCPNYPMCSWEIILWMTMAIRQSSVLVVSKRRRFGTLQERVTDKDDGGSGFDYRHGTDHGIGSYLDVHEGPHLISFRPHVRNVSIQTSMTVTDEPGYCEDGNFGIRLENVLIVNDAGTKFNFGDKCYLSFEHITWAPYQQKLIDLSLLMPEEVDWLNTYHSKCRDVSASYTNESEMAWLKKATEPICA